MPTNDPHVRLKLSNRPENVALVRAMLTGVAEAVELDPEQLDDIRTAVTEACNNAALYAYRGAEGPFEVDVRLAEGSVAVAVRDAGVGLDPAADRRPAAGEPEPEEPDEGSASSSAGGLGEESLKLGIPVIQALAAAVEFRRPAGGGTEVCMQFATPGSRLPEPGSEGDAEAPAIALLPAIGNTSDGAGSIAASIAIAIAPDRMARAVLPRLVCALAARANFSTDRLSDAQLVADVVASEAFAAITGTHLGVGIAIEPRRVKLRVGPLPAGGGGGGGGETAADARLCELGGVATGLIDDHSIAPVGSAAVLALQLIDQR
jgi:serine/threonine-protein kinase RsbW